jgi:transposase-like protein
MEEKKVDFNFEEYKKSAIAGLYAGKGFHGEHGIFAPLLKHFLEAALEGELEAHLKEEKSNGVANRRNGRVSKQVKTASGEFTLESSRDRLSSFEPMVLPKRQLILTDELEEKIVGLYGLGLSTRDISEHIKEMYHMDISATQLSSITDKVIPAMEQWLDRPLEAMYCFVYMDCMFYKAKVDGKITSRAVYNILGVNIEGKKELLGMYVSENEGSKFWLTVLTNLQNRGVKDILIACVDGLKGFPDAIEAIFPHTQVQLCVVHQIRNSMRFVADKDKKAFMADLRPVYESATKELGYAALEKLQQIWGKQYSAAIKPWFIHWDNISTFFSYTTEIRKAIYTTNPIEGFHRQVRKVTKTKGAFTSELSLKKLMYLVTQRIIQKWKRPINGWGQTLSQLSIIYEDRIDKYICPH